MGRASAAKKLTAIPEPTPVPDVPLRLDFGCGPHKREGFIGIDKTAFVGVDVVMDVASEPWPWADGSVAEAHASHFLEHLNALQRCHFLNELYRVLVPGGTCLVIVPAWSSSRAYGDPTHQWPPIGPFTFYYYSKAWRLANAPHADASVLPGGYDCDFEATWGFSQRPDLAVRNDEYKAFACANYLDAIQDYYITLRALKAT